MISRLIGSENYASRRSNKSRIDYNKNNVYGKIYKHIRVGLRSRPSESAYLYANTGRETCYFKVMGKVRDETNKIWYYVELKNDIADYYINTNKAAKGTKVFFSAKIGQPEITVKFDKFLFDLDFENRWFDGQTFSQTDNLTNRITRFRQLGHDSNVSLFSDVIGRSTFNPIYRDNIPYRGGETEEVDFPGNTQITIDTSINLYSDYSAVEFSNSKSVEIQHMFVGLDVLDNIIDPNNNVSFGPIDLVVGNNAYTSLFCGDAGSVAGELLDESRSEKARESIKNLKDDPFEFFMNSKFPEMDQLGDVYSFGLIPLKNTSVVSGNVMDIFNIFNNSLKTGGEIKTINLFIKFIGFDKEKKLTDSSQDIAKSNKLYVHSYHFAWNWFNYFLQNFTANLPSNSEKLSDYSRKATNLFLNNLDKIRGK